MTTHTAPSMTAQPRLVLVADDEMPIQHLITRVIGQLGLVALPVADGAAAIKAVQAHRGNLACAILDVQMPIVNGLDAAQVIQQIAPDLAIVLMSGAIPADYVDPIKRLRLTGMLPKPFSLAALQEMIRHAVGDRIAREVDGL
jgi:CheY-like chemotaxis protein